MSEGRRADRKSQRALALALGGHRETPVGLGCDTSDLNRGRDRLTDDTMALRTLLDKSPDADFLRDMIGFAAERLMELEVAGLTGAAHGDRSGETTTSSFR